MAHQRKRRLDKTEIEAQLEISSESESQNLSEDPIICAEDVEEVLGPFSDLEDYTNGSDVPAETEDEDTDSSVLNDESDQNDGVQGEQEHEEPNRKKSKRGGRVKDGIWTEFEKVVTLNNTWKCIHCEKTFKFPQADRLRKHISNNCDVSRRNRNKELVSDLTILKEVSAPSLPGGSNSESGNRLFQPSVKKFFAATSEVQKKKIDEMLVNVICASNLPFSLVDNVHFVKLLKELRPSYQPPSSKVVSNSLLDSVYNKNEEKVLQKIKGNRAVIMQDGWTTNQSEAVIAHAIYTGGEVQFLDAEVMNEVKKTAENCLNLLQSVIERAEKKYKIKVIGCVTDNCNTMIAMRRELVARNPKMIAYGCNSHLLNLVGRHMTPDELKEQVVSVQKYFRNHDIPAALLKKLLGTRPVLPGDTRWNSQLDCFRSYAKNQAKYLEISRRSECKVPGNIFTILTDNSIFEKVQRALRTLEPIAVGLDQLQGDKATVADAVACWLRISVEVRGLAEDTYFKEQFEKGTPESSIAAFLVNPKYRGHEIPSPMKDVGRRWFLLMNACFLPIVLAFQSADQTFFSPLLMDESIALKLEPVSWWRTAQSDNPTKIPHSFLETCESLLGLPASSAGLERCFSTLGNTITDRRNRISVEKAKKVCFVNHSLRKEA